MQVKIGNTTYDSNDQPIMIILSDQDKINISNMLPECNKYCEYSDGLNDVRIKEWMDS